MKSVKAVAFREPSASRIAIGKDSVAFKGAKTSYRGEILIVSDTDPSYALALAELVGCRPVTSADDTSLRRGYAWEFRSQVPITRFPMVSRNGLFNATVPEGALPQEKRSPLVLAAPVSQPPGVKSTFARELELARVSLNRASDLLPDLRLELSGPHYEQIHAAVEELGTRLAGFINQMTDHNPSWRDLLGPPQGKGVASVASADEHKTARTASRLNILLVDDEPRFARGVQRLLANDHDVRIAHSKQQALDRIADRAPDVLLCDYQIEWQSSTDLLEHVRERHPDVRRVLYSFSRAEVWNDLLNRQIVHVSIPKSAPRTELLNALRV